MVFERERRELIELFKTRHLAVLNDLVEIKQLRRSDDTGVGLLHTALANLKHFLTKPRYFYAILDFIATNYSIDEFDRVKCNGFKLVFEILRTICFHLIKEPRHEEYSRIERRSETVKLLNELLDDDLIEVILHDIGFQVDYLTDSYVYTSREADRVQTLVDMAFDAYLNFYFYDNVLNFIQDYLNSRCGSTCEPLQIIEFLYKNPEVKCYDYEQMYVGLSRRGYLQQQQQQPQHIQPEHKVVHVESTSHEPITEKSEQAIEELSILPVESEHQPKQELVSTNTYDYNNNSSARFLTILTNEQWPCAGCTYLNEPDKTTCALCCTAKYIPNATFL